MVGVSQGRVAYITNVVARVDLSFKVDLGETNRPKITEPASH